MGFFSLPCTNEETMVRFLLVVVACTALAVLAVPAFAGCGCCAFAEKTTTPDHCFQSSNCTCEGRDCSFCRSKFNGGHMATCYCSCSSTIPGGIGFTNSSVAGDSAFRREKQDHFQNGNYQFTWPLVLTNGRQRVNSFSQWVTLLDGSSLDSAKVNTYLEYRGQRVCLFQYDTCACYDKNLAIPEVGAQPGDVAILVVEFTPCSGYSYIPGFGYACRGGGNPWSIDLSLGWIDL